MHTVTLIDADGVTVYKTIQVEDGATIASSDLAAPPKPMEENAFVDWSTEPAVNVPFDPTTPITADITLFAWFTPIGIVPLVHTVTFDSKGGSTVAPQTVQNGQCATKPAAPTGGTFEYRGKSYPASFVGWVTTDGVPWDFSTPVTEGLTLYAQWVQPPGFGWWVLTFDSQGGSPVPSQNINNDNPTATFAKKPADPTRAGYVFGGWFKDKECTQPWDFEKDLLKGDTTLYAKWMRIMLPPTGESTLQGLPLAALSAMASACLIALLRRRKVSLP